MKKSIPITDHSFLRKGEKLIHCFCYYKAKGKRIFAFREEPVPFTSKRRGGSGCYRYPKTLQELRYVTDIDIELAPARRKRCNIPTAWDDIVRKSSRTWKRHRKTQFKPVKHN